LYPGCCSRARSASATGSSRSAVAERGGMVVRCLEAASTVPSSLQVHRASGAH
jgi:hypothetical protein